MKKNVIAAVLRAANSSYPDCLIEQYFDLDTGEEREDVSAGDTLALFIGREIHDLSLDHKTINGAVCAVIKGLESAREELDGVIDYLSKGGK